MKPLTNILGAVLCTAVAVTAQAPDPQQTSDIEITKAQPSGPVSQSKADTDCAKKCVSTLSHETEAEWNIAMFCLERCELDKEAAVYLGYDDMLRALATPLSATPNSYRTDARGKDGQRVTSRRDILDADSLLAFAEKLEKTAWFDESDSNNQYRHVLEDIENLKRQFTLSTTDEMEGLEKKENSEEDVKRTAALRDGPFESMPANEGTDAPSCGDLLDRDSDSPSADEDEEEDAEYAEFLSSNWEHAKSISALWDTRRYVVEVPAETGVSSEGTKRYWVHTYDGRRYGPYDIKDEAKSGLQAPVRRQLYA
ncbi:uncharacterized protein J4E79_007018 [Alternaria viburni]|uniref:uncharacterized protein n=1 Tax=Alternaria viburni TaxID=566460 RepID=UPI0020C1FED8|nr:uncharacterized protein J4E79_007018 [Alternaria viburni]KAI4658612.1 hypothetical protein J4E79_007018 [Alternaria viburni]